MKTRIRLSIPAIALLLTLPLACSPGSGFRDNGDGTVTDLKTNLIWQRCSVGQNNDAACSGGAQIMHWDSGVKACENLSLAGKTWRLPEKDELKSLVRCSDGTPTPLKGYGEGHPYRCGWSGGMSYDKKYQEPTIDPGAFPGTVASAFWSSSTYVANTSNAWIVNFTGGYVAKFKKPGSLYVRCVSGIKRISNADESKPGEPAVTEADRPAAAGDYRDNGTNWNVAACLLHFWRDYRDNDNGTVTDLKTKLIWQRCSVGQNNDAACSGGAQIMHWDSAVQTCEDLKLAGKKWRLPTKDELKGLVYCSDGTPTPLKDFREGSPYMCGWSGGENYEKAYTRPTINAGSFPGTRVSGYWSSSTDVAAPGVLNAWVVAFGGGFERSYVLKTFSNFVRCVSTGP